MKINYEDLFDPTIVERIGGIITKIKEMDSAMSGMLENVRSAAGDLNDSLGGKKGSPKKTIDDVNELYDAYQKLGLGVEYCEQNLKSLISTKERLNKAQKASETINKSEEDSILRMKAQLELVKIALEGMSADEIKTSEEGRILTNVSKSLSSQIKELTKSFTASTKSVAAGKASNVSLAQSYSSLSGIIQKTGIDLGAILTTEKQLAIATKNGEVANNSLEGSYDQLYAQYNLIKNVLNALSKEMRDNADVGKVLEAEAFRIKDALNTMQEATGNYTGSVGNYEKALNGLNISTQQVLREMPTLANSFSQFFIAISNNVPIFVDNLKRAREEMGSWSAAMKGVLTSVFSWQTALLVVLTILPKLAKAIHNKKVALEEQNGALAKNITYLDLLKDALVDVMKAQSDNISDLKSVYAITQDLNRSQEERIAAARYLKGVYDEQLDRYTAEEIALGKADKAVNMLTNSLLRQANARAYLDKIREAYSKRIEVEARMEELASKEIEQAYRKGGDTVKEQYETIAKYAEEEGISFEKAMFRHAELVGKNRKNVNEYADLARSMNEYSKSIDEMVKKINAFGLVTEEDGGSKRTKKALDNLKDYYWMWAEETAEIIQDPMDRELALNDVAFNKEIDILEKELKARKEAGTLDMQQEQYLNSIIISLIIQREERAFEIEQKYHQKLEGLKESEVDLYADINKRILDNANELVQSRKRLDADINKNNYKAAKEESVIYKNLFKEKLRLEAELQKAKLQERNLTQEEYDVELANIEIGLSKAIAKVDKVVKSGKLDLWGRIFGRTGEKGEGSVVKELDAEQKEFVKAFEKAMSSAMKYMDEWMDKRMEMAEIAAEAANKESEAAKTALDYEMEARANGYANNIELARKEYEEKLQMEMDALKEKEKLEKQQRNIDTATQASSLITAAAELWSSHASMGPIGVALAVAATTAMFGTFLAAKSKANQVAKYGDGMSEYLDYGGSHASGNDIDFGVTKDGKHRRVERGEMIGVINKRNVSKYGVNTISDIIGSLNSGTFSEKYTKTNALNDMLLRESMLDAATRGTLYSSAFSGFKSADLSSVEQGIGRLVEQGETKVVATPTGRIEYRGNTKRIIHN